ncbi:hypothetical protein TMatcc_009700 [Talaromyces marneffei ATCC 18224]
MSQFEQEDLGKSRVSSGMDNSPLSCSFDAQYEGLIFFESGKCLHDIKAKKSKFWISPIAREKATNFSQDYASTSFNVLITGPVMGTNIEAPATCPTSFCDSCCQTADTLYY